MAAVSPVTTGYAKPTINTAGPLNRAAALQLCHFQSSMHAPSLRAAFSPWPFIHSLAED
jgi:hypothetical protein